MERRLVGSIDCGLSVAGLSLFSLKMPYFMKVELLAWVGFMLAAYSIVANDAIQTLGTFLSSNSRRPWWVLWLYACTILTAVMAYGWVQYGGDVSYGRLNKFPEAEGGILWYHLVPPFALLILTRLGAPVSTTFLILTTFRPENLGGMLTKSVIGYLLAMAVGLAVYGMITRPIEKKFLATAEEQSGMVWGILQWCSTGFLWSMWLIQDLANIYIYLPRCLSIPMLLLTLGLMWLLHAIIFYQNGGEIQKIVTSKTNTTDIRSATIIDFLYAFILLLFKEMGEMPMSTTWVFLGLLAGREMSMSWQLQHRRAREVTGWIMKDLGKAVAGLVVSVVLAYVLPRLAGS